MRLVLFFVEDESFSINLSVENLILKLPSVDTFVTKGFYTLLLNSMASSGNSTSAAVSGCSS